MIDEEVAGVVRRIYDLYLNGESTFVIAEMLNSEGVESPAAYKERIFQTFKQPNVKHYLWNRVKVLNILKDPTYCGNLTQRKYRKVNYKVDKGIALPPRDWVTVEGTHEGIVSAEDFENVKFLISKRANNNTKRGQNNRLLNGLLFCKECGSKMTYRRSGTHYYTICLAYSRFGLKVCYSSNLPEKPCMNKTLSLKF